jgi:hypothetical protein
LISPPEDASVAAVFSLGDRDRRVLQLSRHLLGLPVVTQGTVDAESVTHATVADDTARRAVVANGLGDLRRLVARLDDGYAAPAASACYVYPTVYPQTAGRFALLVLRRRCVANRRDHCRRGRDKKMLARASGPGPPAPAAVTHA